MGIRARGVGKEVGAPPVRILDGIDVDIRDGEFVSISGRSGSGKSSLLYVLSTLDAPTRGAVEVSGRDVTRLSEEELHLFRNESMGFVFQFHYLLAELTALENVLMPARKPGRLEERRPRAEKLLADFGLEGKARRLPRQLSGGEQQRVAIARALVMEPRYLFADEPTGSLDSLSGERVMELLCGVHRLGTTVVMVTHDPDFAAMAQRQIRLSDGRVVG